MTKRAKHIFVVLLLLMPFMAYPGQTTWQKTIFKANITTGSRMVVKDLTSADETSGNNAYYGASRTGLVTLVYGREKHTDVSTASPWSYKIVYDVTFNGPGGIAQTFTDQELYVSYAGATANHVIEDLNVYENVPANADIVVTGITSTGTVPADVRLELAVSANKARFLNYAANNFLFNYKISGNDIELYWDYFPGAESYELEWVFVDSEDPDAASFNPSALSPLNPFEHYEAVRITTANQYYKIQRTYPVGRLFFRLRPVGLFTEFINNGNYTYRKNGPWISNFYNGTSSTVAHYYNFNPFEHGKTWQSVVTYAEQGKSKEVVTYYDGSSRNRQTVVNLNTDGTVIVSETKYDYEGRPVVQILPTPIAGTSLSFKTDFTKNGAGNIYSAADFDDATTPSAISNTAGAGKYYSSNNDLSNSLSYIPNFDYIPSASGYPFTQVRYMKDNSGRVERSSGLGNDHKLYGGHDVKYYYAGASSTELHRLFGENVGEAKYYKKVISADPNGQVSIAYQDHTGKTIATALLGENPDNVLPLNVDAAKTWTVNLNGNNVFDPATNTWTVTFPKFNEVPNNEHVFSYNAYAQINGIIGGQSLCFGCSYDFTFYIEGPNGQRVELYDLSGSGANYNATDNILTAHYGQDCGYTPDPYSDLLGIKASFDDIGIYTIYKILKLNAPDFTDASLLSAISSNVIPLGDIEEGYVANFNYDNCDLNCAQKCSTECVTPGTVCNNCLASCNEITTSAYNEAVNYLAENSCEGYLAAMKEQIRPGGYYFENEDPANGSDAFWTLLAASGKIPTLTDQEGNPLGYSSVTNVQDNWATYGEYWMETFNLIEQHPEICVYAVKCIFGNQLMKDARIYESRLFTVPNWSVAAVSGYLAPFTSGSVTVTYTTSAGTQTVNISAEGTGLSKDPTTNFGAGGSSFLGFDLYGAIYNKLYDYRNGYSLWEFTDKDCPEHGGALYGAIDVNNSVEYNKWRWFLFRAMYLDLREEVFNQVMINHCGSNSYIDATTGYLANQTEAVFKHRGYTGDPTDMVVSGLIDAAAEDNLNTTCQGNVDLWLNRIKSYLYFNREDALCMPANADTEGEFVIWWAAIENGIRDELTHICETTTYRDAHGLPVISDVVLAGCSIPTILANAGAMGNCASLAESTSCGYKVRNWMAEIFHNCPGFVRDPGSMEYAALEYALGTFCEEYSNVIYTGVEITPKLMMRSSELLALNIFISAQGGCPDALAEYAATIEPSAIDPCIAGLLNSIDDNLPISGPINGPGCMGEECVLNKIVFAAEKVIHDCRTTECTLFGIYNQCGDPIDWDDVTDIAYYTTTDNPGYTLSGKTFGGIVMALKVAQPYTYSCLIDPIEEAPPLTVNDADGYVLAYVFTILEGGCGVDLQKEDNWADQWREDCRQMMEEIALYQARQEYQRLLDEQFSLYINGRQCTPSEEFSMSYKYREYHHTLYYYDQSGHLVQTVPPEGVAYLEGTTYFNADGSFKSGNNYYPPHRMASKYRYNSIGQVVHQSTPDGGEARFWYNKASQLRFSQNSKQQPNDEYSYTCYDGLGRITEAGEMVSPDFLVSLGAMLSSPLVYQNVKKETVMTVYDGGPNGRNRVSSTIAVDFGYHPLSQASEFYRHITITSYTYDVQGNVKSLYQELGSMGGLGLAGGTGKRINYGYDLISGNVHRVRYQPGKADEFNHRYTYDADNRLTSVYTSKDGWLWEEDARYFYYPHGPLARVELGQDKLQGLDYYYTVHGWLKGINTPGGDHTTDILGSGPDPGQDGFLGTGNHDRWTGRDELALGLGYYSGDYLPIAGSGWAKGAQESPWADMAGDIPGTGLFNGNIAWMGTQVPELQRQSMGSPLEAYAFKYDQLHRLRQNRRWAWDGTDWGNTVADRYREDYAYDKNGNLSTLDRYDGAGIHIDGLDYRYALSSGEKTDNRLLYVADAAAGSGTRNDLLGQASGNYAYDPIGNLVSDDAEGITGITWNVQGKIERIRYNLNLLEDSYDIEFIYDGMGQRVAKIVKPHAGIDMLTGNIGYKGEEHWTQTFYVRDATGTILATYEKRYVSSAVDFALTEQPIYGSSRIGILNRHINPVTGDGYDGQQRILGQKMYELANHLGNVNAVISDVRIGVDERLFEGGIYTGPFPDGIADYYRPKVVSATDYYPFGWTLPDRSFNSGDYRFGYQGSERDNEIANVNGGHYTTFYRLLDTRIGRWASVDPVTQPSESPYTSMANNPIFLNDPQGDCPPCVIFGVWAARRALVVSAPLVSLAFKGAFVGFAMQVSVNYAFYGDFEKTFTDVDYADVAIDGAINVVTGGGGSIRSFFREGSQVALRKGTAVLTLQLVAATTDLSFNNDFDAKFKSVFGGDKDLFEATTTFILSLSAQYSADEIKRLFTKWSKIDLLPENFAPKTKEEKELAVKMYKLVTSDEFNAVTENGTTFMANYVDKILSSGVKLTVKTIDTENDFESKQDNTRVAPPIDRNLKDK